MSSDETSKKSKARNNENGTQQTTITLTFVPETKEYQRPKNMEEYARSYFESINGISKRIIAEERKVIAQNRNTWPTLPVEERDKLLNDRMIRSDVRQKYNNTDEYWREQTPWQAEKLMADNLSPRRDDKSKSVCNDSFSTPFQWATKSQRNISFPEIKREKLNNIERETTQPRVEKKEPSIKKVNNVEKTMQEKQIKIDNTNGVRSETNMSVSTKQEDNTELLETHNGYVEDEEGETSSGEPKVDEKQYLDGTKNIFEFLQSWDP